MNICLALVAFITLLGVLKRRNIALGGWGTAALCFLYWGGWKLAFVMQMGRIDILIMLFTLLVADALLPGANIEDGGTKSVAVYAFFLMLSGIYTVPFLILSSPLIAMLYRSNRVFVIKWVRMIIGFSLSFAMVCLYYFYRGTFLEFVYTYFQFNSVLTGTSEFQGSSRVLSAYLLDVEALVLFVAGVVFLSFGKVKVPRPIIALIGLTPFLMVISGRFMDYYAWVFYIPSTLLVIYAMLPLGRGRVIRCFCCIVGVMAFIRPIHEWSTEKRDVMAEGERFVMEHEGLFARDAVVVLADDIAYPDGKAIENIFYYPLVQRGVCVWRRNGNALSYRPSFQEKVDSLVEKSFKSCELRNCISRLCRFLYRKPNEQGWPSEGVLLVRNRRTFYDCIQRLRQEKADVHIVDQKKDVNCAVFSRKR
ncbi:MAG: hypothetical protein IJI54_00690 [Kiritimatiellae bacterium]|nr:hypothetical protein [Kiritimatiellia bacterium]